MVCITRRVEGSDDSGYGSALSTGSTTTIERWVARKDKFRIAADGQVPIPLRSRRFNVDPELKGVYDSLIAPRIPEVIARHGLSFTGSSLNRLQPSEEAYGAKDVLSVTTSDINPRTAWNDAANDVLAYVRWNAPSHTLGSIQVLIANVDEMYEDVSSALPNDPAIVGPLEQVKDQIVEEVSASMQNVWTSIAFHMRRRRRELNAPRKPTVIVFCRPLSICEFAAVEERLLGILNTIETQIHLEFIPGRVVLARPGSPHPRPMRQQPRSLSENPVNGSSIGVKGREAEAGTLGGWLILNLPREKRQVKCALSCYHVIRSEIASVAGHTDTNGVHWDDPRGRLTIEYPADLDGKATMARLDELCKFGPHDQQLQQQYNMLSRLMSGPGIGKVFLASGHQRRKNHRLDWALIETIETFSHNKPPSPSLGGNAEFMLPETGPEYNPHPDAKIRHFGSAKEGDWVVKIGRTTLTSGVINAMKTVTWAPGNTSEEIEIVSEHADFAAGGDSGSFVINAHGELVGLLFAVEKNSCGWDTAYMTPIRLIQDHIKEVTGGGFLSFD